MNQDTLTGLHGDTLIVDSVAQTSSGRGTWILFIVVLAVIVGGLLYGVKFLNRRAKAKQEKIAAQRKAASVAAESPLNYPPPSTEEKRRDPRRRPKPPDKL